MIEIESEHRIRRTLRRLEWLATEWPAVIVWGGWATFVLERRVGIDLKRLGVRQEIELAYRRA